MARATAVTIGALLAIAGTAPAADAATHYWKESDGTVATYVYRFTVTLAPCTSNVFETSNLSAGADTVMYLIESNTEVAYSDDHNGELRSRIQYSVVCGGPSRTVTAWVMAKSNATGGAGGKTFRFKMNGISQGDHRLGGYIAVTGTATRSTDTMETVLVNNGAAATMLIRLRWDGNHYRFAAANQSGGVGLASKLSGASDNSQRWVIATPSEATREGAVRLVRNDVATGDVDKDGLGNGLELDACTCSSSGSFACSWGPSYNCTAVANKQDSDGDGLKDDWELIGIDDTSSRPKPQLFPLWGASPRHKDLFLEMDLDESFAARRTTEEQAQVAARPYRELPIQNLDGVGGVSLHIDIGQPCFDEAGDVDNLTPICGDFGGENLAVDDPDQPCSASLDANLAPIRHGKFHWMLRTSENGHTKNQCSWINDNQALSSGTRLIAHELGHQLGLTHWGANSAGVANRKPHYPSLMNYTYTSSFNGSLANVQFSDGSLVAHTIDPRDLSETTNYGGSTNIDFLVSPYHFDFDNDPAHPRHIDWNRDGDFDPSVRAHVIGQPEKRDFGGRDQPTQVGQSHLPAVTTHNAVGAARLGDVTFVVANVGGAYRYSRRAGNGNWSAWTTLASSPSFRPDSSPMVVTYQDEIYVIGVASTGLIRFARFDQSGMLVGSWAGVTLPPGVVAKEVSAAVHDSSLYVVLANATGDTADLGDVWIGALDGNSWAGWSPMVVSGSHVRSKSPDNSDVVTPAVASAPDGKLYLYSRNPTSNSFASMIELFELAGETWSSSARGWSSTATTNCLVVGRMNATFRQHRSGAGVPLASGNGAIWLWYNAICDGTKDEVLYSWTWGRLNPSSQDFDFGKWHRTNLNPDGCYVGESTLGVTVVDQPESLAAYVVHGEESDCAAGVFEVPHADGEATPATPLADYNDAAHIESRLCSAVHWIDGACKCADFSATACAPRLDGESYDCNDWIE